MAVIGHIETIAALNEFDVAFRAEVADAGDRALGRAMAKEAKANAPQDFIETKQNKEYGTLIKGINTKKIRKNKGGGYAVSIGRAFWGLFINYGTKNFEGNGFMTKAFEGADVHITTTWTDAAGKAMDRISKRIGGKYSNLRASDKRKLAGF